MGFINLQETLEKVSSNQQHLHGLLICLGIFHSGEQIIISFSDNSWITNVFKQNKRYFHSNFALNKIHCQRGLWGSNYKLTFFITQGSVLPAMFKWKCFLAILLAMLKLCVFVKHFDAVFYLPNFTKIKSGYPQYIEKMHFVLPEPFVSYVISNSVLFRYHFRS